MRIFWLPLMIGLSAVSAQAATPITQDRDEPVRNPYQQMASANCGNTLNCNLTFPAIPKGRRAVVTNISCDAFTTSGNSGLKVKLGSSANTTVYTSFFATPYGSNTFGQFPANWSTLFFIASGAAPTLQLLSGFRFSGTQACFLSGYTVAIP